ncbi:hypothetical protein [Saccharopolyspora rosea]|uniref:hypothetical protein n=1 Tax=Saccharopolyspora rosea TaxID=524884 RepID=UPI0021D9C016|nr:hypothetical protein [Saccharopolyspora rosea]
MKHSRTKQAQRTAEVTVPMLLPLLGTPCAVCAHPARWIDTARHVVHVDLRLRPCPLPPNPAIRPVSTDLAEVAR